METFLCERNVKAMLVKTKCVCLWAVCFLIPHALTDIRDASAANLWSNPGPPSFTGTVGGTIASKTLTINSDSPVSWSASDNVSWLSLSQSSSSTPGTLTFTINTSGLAAGTYNGLVTISSPSAPTHYSAVTLTLTGPSGTPAIGFSPTSLSFNGAVGGTNPTAQSISITNTGGGTLSWSTSDNASWLTLSPASGSGSGTVTANVNTAGLSPGNLNATITVSASGVPSKTIPVALSMAAAPIPPAIGASPAGLSFTAPQNGSNPAAQTLNISNTGGGTLSWSANENGSWLTLSPASGSGNGTITANVNTAGLAAGTFNATITVSATGATSKTIPVSFTVTAASVPPSIGASPASLSFAATQGGSNPGAQSIGINNTGGGTLTWNANDNASWLTLNPATGSGGGTVTATVNTAGLAAGTFNGMITVAATGATPKSIPVTLTITATSAASIYANPGPPSFTATVGGPSPSPQTFTVSSTGGPLSWSASDNASWLSVGAPSGTTPGTFIISVNPTGLVAGTYNGLLTITAPAATNNPLYMAVTFTVTAGSATPTIGLSPTSLSFSGSAGGTNPAAQTISVANTGGGTLSWSASDNASWLSLSPASGSGNGAVTANVSTAGLAAGTVNATITVTASGAPSKTIPVALTVTPAGGSTPSIGLSPTSFSFTATQGAANPASQTLTVRNPGGGTLTWSIADNQNWLTMNTTSGTTGTETDSVTVSVNTSGLQAGNRTATITVTATGASNTPQTIPVTLALNPPATSSATLTWNANNDSDLGGYKIYRATASGAYGAPIATLQGTVTSYPATGLSIGTTYFFVITAYDKSGNESTFSNEVSKSIF